MNLFQRLALESSWGFQIIAEAARVMLATVLEHKRRDAVAAAQDRASAAAVRS